MAAGFKANVVGVPEIPIDNGILSPLLGLDAVAVGAEEGVTSPGCQLRQHLIYVFIRLAHQVVGVRFNFLKPLLRPFRFSNVSPGRV